MINNVVQSQLLAVKNYKNFSDQKNKDKYSSLAENLKNRSEKSSEKDENKIATAAISAKKSKNETDNDNEYSPSETATKFKEIIGVTDLTNINSLELIDLAKNLYKENILGTNEFYDLTSSNSTQIDFSQKDEKQDIIKIWEERLKQLKESDSPPVLITRTKSILQVLKSLNALSATQES